MIRITLDAINKLLLGVMAVCVALFFIFPSVGDLLMVTGIFLLVIIFLRSIYLQYGSGCFMIGMALVILILIFVCVGSFFSQSQTIPPVSNIESFSTKLLKA